MTTTTGKKSGRLLATRILAGVSAALGLAALVFGFVSLIGNPSGIHAVHDIGGGALVGVLFGGAMLGVAVRPRPAAVQQMLAIVAALLVASLLAGRFDPFVLIFVVLAALVAGLAGVPMMPERIRVASLPLVAIAMAIGVPLLVYGWGQIRLQGGPPSDPHVEFGHFVGQAALALAITVTGLLASLKSDGWRISGWSAGLALLLMGAASLITGQASAFPRPGAIASLMAGALQIVVTEWEIRRAPGVAARSLG